MARKRGKKKNEVRREGKDNLRKNEKESVR